MYENPAAVALETARRFAALDESVAVEDAVICMAELGRLAGPLAPVDGIPDAQKTEAFKIAECLESVLHHLHGQVEQVFEESAGEYRALSKEELWFSRREVIEELKSVWRKSFHDSRDQFTYLYPFDGPLPDDSDARLAEQDRRAGERQLARTRGIAAIRQLVDPILIGDQTVRRLQQERDAEIETANRLDRERLRELNTDSTTRAEYPPPAPQRYGVSARGAEMWVADALRWLGATDVEVTRASADGGVDVLTSEYAVSVKHYAGSVPVEEVREIFGVGTVMKLTPLLWTSGSLTSSGAQFAEVAQVPVFHYSVETAKIRAVNKHAQDLLDHGL